MLNNNNIKTWWSDNEVSNLELSFLHDMFDCTNQEGVDVAYMYAKFMSKKKLTPDNYPIFMRLLETGNHWVIDALLAGSDPVLFFKVVQPNSYIISRCFNMLYRWKPGEVYPKLFLMILGILRTSYENSTEGFRLFPLTEENVNSLGKHLERELGQEDPVNSMILHLLDRIATTEAAVNNDEKKREKTATQANNIRGKFLDITKKLSEAIPLNLLVRGDYKKSEIAPAGFKK